MSQNRKHQPRTGDGRKGHVKPKDAGVLRMMSADKNDGMGSGIRRKQPKGWGIARVIDIVTGRERER